MTGFSNLQALLIQSVNMFFQVIYFLILIRIVLSWLPVNRNSGIGGLIYSLTEPILGPIRSMLNKSPIGGGMMLDFSPVIALFVMDIAKMILIGFIQMF